MKSAEYRADVVVAGGGLAGLVTAMELLDRGRSVVLLERSAPERLGGLARESFGGIFLVGTPEQRRTGIRDTVDLALGDWLRYGEHGDDDAWPRRWAEAYVSGCRERVYDWLRQRGVRFFPVVNWAERGIDQSGNSVPRFHLVWGAGVGLVGGLLDSLERHPRRDRLLILHRHRVTDLVRTAGSITGCTGVIDAPDPDAGGVNSGREFVAEGDAVVLASGGIMGRLDKVRQNWPKSWGPVPTMMLNGSDPSADGHMHEVAGRYGARVTHMDRMWMYAAGVRHWKPRHPAHGVALVPPKSALWLDSRGVRFGPRPLVGGFDTRQLVKTICRQPKPYSWQVLNWRIAKRELTAQGAEFNHAIRDKDVAAVLKLIVLGNEALVHEFVDNCGDIVTGSTVAELAGRMNDLAGSDDVDAVALEAEIRQYDASVGLRKRSDDEQVRMLVQARRNRADRARTCKFATIGDPKGLPLIAIREQILTRKSLGGMQTDLSCRVLDMAGEPLAGLFAVGEAAGFGGGGIHGVRSLEGTFLGGCIFGGRLAAAAIADG